MGMGINKIAAAGKTKWRLTSFATILALSLCFTQTAMATPSSQIRIPSVDIQPYDRIHFGVDTFNSIGSKSSEATANTINYGLTFGLLQDADIFGIEMGADFRDISGDSRNPFLYNAKMGMKEGTTFLGVPAPAVVLGIFDFGINGNSNIVYLLTATTFDPIGRLSVGYAKGNSKTLETVTNSSGTGDESGVMFSWDRHLSGKLWAAVDYLGSDGPYGALSFGMSYALSERSKFLLGYVVYNNSNLHQPAITFQFDMDL